MREKVGRRAKRVASHESVLILLNTVDSRYLAVQMILWNTSRYPYLDISDLRIVEKNKSNSHISHMNMYIASWS